MALSRPLRINNLRGAVLVGTATAVFTVVGVMVRLASEVADNAQIVFFRSLIGILPMLPMLLRGRRERFRLLATRMPWLHVFRAGIGLAGMYCFFYALAHMPLSYAMLFTYSAAIFVPVIGWLWMREHLNLRTLLALAIGLSGILIVMRPQQSVLEPVMALIGLGSSLCAAFAFVSVRRLAMSEPPYRVVFYFTLYSVLISVVPLFWSEWHLDSRTLGLLCCVGLLATLGQYLMSLGYSLGTATTLAPVTYLAMVWAGLIGWLLWGEEPGWVSGLGMGLAFLAALLTVRRRME